MEMTNVRMFYSHNLWSLFLVYFSINILFYQQKSSVDFSLIEILSVIRKVSQWSFIFKDPLSVKLEAFKYFAKETPFKLVNMQPLDGFLEIKCSEK